MTTRQTKTKNNFNRRKNITGKNITGKSCGKCGCQLKNQPKSESKFEWIKKFVLKLLHLG
jgi:hypothetical protein